MSGFFIFRKKIYYKNKNFFFGKGFKILFDLVYNNHNIIVADYLIKFDLRRNNKSKMNLKVIYHLIISIIKKIVFKLT